MSACYTFSLKRYEIFDLGGNPTAIILENVGKQDGIEIAKQIMQAHPIVEQVAIIESMNDETCTFRMAGGEFCGNAIRAVAEYMRRTHGKEKSRITICGIEIDATSDGISSEISLPKKSLLVGKKDFYIIMNGINHAILMGEGDEAKAMDVKSKAEKIGLVGDAFGVMFVGENLKINPFVWVTQAQTFFNETACLSGSIAVAVALEKNLADIIQPTGEIYRISINNDKISARGKVAFISEGVI